MNKFINLIWMGIFFGMILIGMPAYGIEEPEMVLVKGGCYEMGNSSFAYDEKPVHTVCVSDFFIGKNMVTQQEWKEIMGETSWANCDQVANCVLTFYFLN